MTDQPTLRASEMIAKLQEAIARRGDLRLFVKDADTGWLLGMRLKVEGDPENNPDVPCFVLDTDYL